MVAAGQSWWRNNWKKAAGCGCLGMIALAAVVSALVYMGSRSSVDFQLDADVFRLRHLRYYGGLIEEYREATGKYPLQGRETIPIYVLVAHDQQMQRQPPGPPYEHVSLPFAALVAEIESGLGREIDEYYDPQLVPVFGPNFYIYKVAGDNFVFAVHLYGPMPFAKRVGKHYYKVEISSDPTAIAGTLDSTTLFASAEFRNALARPTTKPEFFEARERKYLRYTDDDTL